MKETLFRQLPSVDALLASEEGRTLVASFGHNLAVKAARDVLEDIRSRIAAGGPEAPGEASLEQPVLIGLILDRLHAKVVPSLQPAVNATGIIMHSGLGRAVLAPAALEALETVGRGYSTLALDLETGRRSTRDVHVESILKELTGAEAATVANNNAAATMLVLNTLARGREVVVSRGQLVEIGGSFRLPDVMRTSGAVLREVGTTNKTHLRDYAEALGEATGVILRVHHSNYRILGFAEEPGLKELAELGRKHEVPVVDDLGSGALVDLKAFGLETEPLVQESIRSGADIACFSGDKLIGGPQSGIIVGRAEHIQRIKRNPLARAFRCGKLTLAALEATLKLFLRPDLLAERHPVYRMFALDVKSLERRARAVSASLKRGLKDEATVSVGPAESQVGSGAVPVQTLPSRALIVRPARCGPDELGRRLRRASPPVFSRVAEDAVWLDFRTIQPHEDRKVADILLRVLKA